jgi:hypothetical protein
LVVGSVAGCELVAGIDDRVLHEASSGSGAAAGNGGLGGTGPGGAGGCPSTGDCNGDGVCDCEGWCAGNACTSPPEGPFLWLRSDADLTVGAAGLTWKDQVSGELATSDEADFVPTLVTSDEFAGHQAVRFDGVDDRIALPAVDSNLSQGFTAAFVLREVAAAPPLDGVLFLGRQTSRDTFGQAVVIERDDFNQLRFTVQNNYAPFNWPDGVLQTSRPLATLPPHAQMLIVTQRADDATAWFHLDGVSLPKLFGDAGLPAASLRDASFLGWSPEGTFDGDIAEVLLYERSLSDSERSQVESYFAAKYAIELAPPCRTCPEILASGQGRPSWIAAFGKRVAWTNMEGGQVMTIEDVTVPTAPEPIHAPGATFARPTGVALDAAGIYWGEGEVGVNNLPYKVHRVLWTGLVHESANAGGEVSFVAIDDAILYAGLYTNGLSWVAESSWIATTLVGSKRVPHVAADPTHVYFSYSNGLPGDGLYRVPKPLGSGSLDANAQPVVELPAPGQVLLDAAYAYVTVLPPGVVRVDKDNGTIEPVVSDGIRAIALAPPHLFYTTADSVKRVAVTGGPVTTIAEGLTEPFAIVVVDDWLVWSNPDGTIMRLPKP